MPVAVTTVITYTIHMTDNIIPFDAVFDEPTPADSTVDTTACTTSDPVSDDVIKLRDVQQRFDTMRTLIDSVCVMIQDWIDANEEYSPDDLGVVSRMVTSLEQAVHLTVDEPEQ